MDACRWRATLLGLAAIIAMASAACGGSSAPLATPTAVVRAGALYYGSDLGLMRLQLDGSAPVVVIPRPTPTIGLIDPALSPDGKQLVFGRQLPLKVIAGAKDVSSDLWIASSDGSGARELIAHSGVNERLIHAQWRDAQHLYVVIQHQSDAADTKTTTFNLEDVDITTGARTTILGDVAGFDLARTDGALAYSVAMRSPYAGSVFFASTRGSPVALLTPAEPLGFASAPRFSPDGSSIAFTAFDRAALINANDEHPAAAQLFVSPRSGVGRRLVAEIDAETPPSLSWSDDGAYIYVAASAIVEVTVATGEIRTLVEGGTLAGTLVWSAR